MQQVYDFIHNTSMSDIAMCGSYDYHNYLISYPGHPVSLLVSGIGEINYQLHKQFVEQLMVSPVLYLHGFFSSDIRPIIPWIF